MEERFVAWMNCMTLALKDVKAFVKGERELWANCQELKEKLVVSFFWVLKNFYFGRKTFVSFVWYI